MFLLLSYIFSITKSVYLFDYQGLKNKNGYHADRIAWKSVKHWSIEEEEEYLIVKFRLKMKGLKTMRFHKSHGKASIESLIKKFLNNSR